MKALFVDDDPVVLSTLRRGLFENGTKLECQFAFTIVDAMAALDREPFDAIICDLATREMDGAALLQVVADRHPSTLRIMLSAHTDENAALRAAAVAHEFLNKNVAVDVLVDTIQRGLHRRDSLVGGSGLAALVGRVGALPAPPELFLRLGEVMNDPNASSAAVSAVLQSSPVVVGKLLQLVNSSFFATPQRIVTLEAAVARLGLRLVRAVVLTEGVFAEDDGNGVYSLAHQRRGRFEAAAAMTAAQAISTRGPDRETAVTASLLANIGVPLLASVAPELAMWIRDRVEAGVDQITSELEVMGISHAAFAGHVLSIWNLPDDVVDAVARHHDAPTAWDAHGITSVAWRITEKRHVDVEALRSLDIPPSSLAMVRELVGARR